jgi:hypothetical protein
VRTNAPQPGMKENAKSAIPATRSRRTFVLGSHMRSQLTFAVRQGGPRASSTPQNCEPALACTALVSWIKNTLSHTSQEIPTAGLVELPKIIARMGSAAKRRK